MPDEEAQSVRTRTMEGKVVLITNADRGVGAVTARLFGQQGASVIVHYQQASEEAQNVTCELEKLGVKAIAIQADIEDEAQVLEMVREGATMFGGVDILVTNIEPENVNAPRPFEQSEWQEFEKTVTQALAALYVPARVVMPTMIEKKSGVVLIVSSFLRRQAMEHVSPLVVSVAGLKALIGMLESELVVHGIRVETVAPELVETSERRAAVSMMTPIRRLNGAEALAEEILLRATNLKKASREY